MTIIIAILVVASFALAITAGIIHHINKRRDEAELAQIAALPLDQRLAKLASAVSECENAYRRVRMARAKHRSYKWDYRNNPYFMTLVTSESWYARAHAWHLKIEALCKNANEGK